MALVETDKECVDLISLTDIIGSVNITETLETAVHKYHLDSNSIIHKSILSYKKIEDIQNNKLSSISKTLIENGVDNIQLFNVISPYLKGIYLKGFVTTSNWKIPIQLRSNSNSDILLIGDYQELLKQYHRFFPVGKLSAPVHYLRSQYNSQDLDQVRALGSNLIRKGLNFIINLKASFTK